MNKEGFMKTMRRLTAAACFGAMVAFATGAVADSSDPIKIPLK